MCVCVSWRSSSSSSTSCSSRSNLIESDGGMYVWRKKMDRKLIDGRGIKRARDLFFVLTVATV